jgi:hypothetical protein
MNDAERYLGTKLDWMAVDQVGGFVMGSRMRDRCHHGSHRARVATGAVSLNP